MGKGKKSSGKTYTSKGERRSSMSTRSNDQSEKMMNKLAAWKKGSNPWITIENPDKNAKDKRFIRVRMNDLMHGSAKELEKRAFIMN